MPTEETERRPANAQRITGDVLRRFMDARPGKPIDHFDQYVIVGRQYAISDQGGSPLERLGAIETAERAKNDGVLVDGKWFSVRDVFRTSVGTNIKIIVAQLDSPWSEHTSS